MLRNYFVFSIDLVPIQIQMKVMSYHIMTHSNMFSLTEIHSSVVRFGLKTSTPLKLLRRKF